MRFHPLARTLLMAGSLAGMLLAATSSRAQNDPPGSARLAFLEGSVSIQPTGVEGWGQAYPNMPVGPGDRVATGEPGQGELQAAQVRAYFSSRADLTLIRQDYQGVELGIAQGSASIFSDGFGPGQGMSVQTPNGAVTIAGRAAFRIDTYPDQQSTVVTAFPNSSALVLNGGGGFYMDLRPGESVQLTGTNPVYAQPLEPPPYDEFAHWSGALESHRLNSISARYVSPEMHGYDELDSAGDWQPDSDYGPIWFPRVAPGWAPYRYGHWVNIPFYGWSWVADEPWGAAPFHYGRWVQLDGRWGWIPGPREAHPIWSPAQVVFAGGVQFGGVGVSVWFPLGPGEAYRPWYPCSPAYINQVNVSNIHESRVVHVQNTYINVVNVTNVTYINRTVGVTAMRQEDFSAGRSTREVAPVKVDPRELEHVQPLARPPAPPPAQRIILHPASRPATVQAARPMLINSKGEVAATIPGAKPVPAPVKPVAPPPVLPGRAPIGTPTVGGKPAMVPAKPAAEPARPMSEPSRPMPPAQVPPKPTPTPAKTVVEPVRPVPEASKPSAMPTRPAAEPVKPPANPPANPPAKPEAKPAPAPAKDPAKSGDKKKEDKRPQ